MVNCNCKDDKLPKCIENRADNLISFTNGEIIRLPVFIKDKDVKVKIDSMVEIFFQLENPGTGGTVTSEFNYILERSSINGTFTPLATIRPFQNFNFPDDSSGGSMIPNLTCLDKPGVGQHVYRIRFNNSQVVFSISIIPNIRFRSINATVLSH
ncbi:hypothetical protein [Bacillus sp. SM2101]|uniref:hypothetical protein n=1 Tax=Bacillus sp. SM2101 TaxID=2805366 RepID=UPI001BDE0BDA|nr:hypothetical protein [Bacillus sp. SM2101]